MIVDYSGGSNIITRDLKVKDGGREESERHVTKKEVKVM